MSVDFCKVVHDVRDEMTDCAADLMSLAKSFSRVGNDSVAAELEEVARAITSNYEKVIDAYDKELRKPIIQPINYAE